MYNNEHKCCCKDKGLKKDCNCEKHCHHEESSNHCCQESCLRRRCCKCRGYCNMIYFKKYNGCCKFVYKCQCGYCFEIICDYKNNCSYERECCCLDKKETINVKICCVEESCQKKKNCSHNCSRKNKCCK